MNINGQRINKAGFSKTLCFMFSGKAGAGKTTAADCLVEIAEKDGLSCEKFSFASHVKKTAYYLGWNGEKDYKGRKLLQSIGNVGRSYDENIFVYELFRKVERSGDYPFDIIVIDDWRFPNELYCIDQEYGLYKPVTVRISRNGYSATEGDTALDVSEVSLDSFNFQYFIENDETTMDNLYKNVYDIYANEVLSNIRK